MERLNDNQLKQLADFSSNLSILFLGSVVGPIFSPVENINSFMLLLGLVLTLLSLVVSIFLLKGTK